VTSNEAPQLGDRILRRLLIAFGILAVLHIALALWWGPGPIIAVFTWYVPLMHGFLALSAFGIAFLSFGRYQVLREPAPFWIGMGFSSFALLSVFYLLSWPGLLSNEEGLIAQRPDTSSWFWHLKFSILAAFLLASVPARWPRANAIGEQWWPRVAVAWMALLLVLSVLLVAYEQLLPPLLEEGTFTAPNLAWNLAIIVAFLLSCLAWARRYERTGDPVFAYGAFAQLILAFAMVTTFIGGRRYDLWWYWQRILEVGAFLLVLFGLLSEYVALYRRERDRAHQLEELQRVVEEERQQLQVLIDTAPVGIIFHSGPDGRLVLFNRKAEQIAGRPMIADAGLAAQASYFKMLRPDGQPMSPEELPAACALRGTACEGVEMRIQHPSGRDAYVLANSAPLRNAAGQIIGAIVVFQDITGLKEQERLRDEFISTAAHELKTPVTTIKGYAQMLGKWVPGGDETREGRAIEVVNRQADRINRRVQEMLEAVRFRMTPQPLRRMNFDLGSLAAEVVERLQSTSTIHRLLLHREGPVPVYADREGIEDVLVSLVDNAMKFSPEGGDIKVRVWIQDGNAVVSVQDRGVGIPQERQSHIFEPFYDAIPPGAPGYRGVVALSLYLSKLNVGRHDGNIWFESQEGKGSTFYFSIPLAEGGSRDGEG